MVYTCKKCSVNWFPYMTVNGACPECGSGTYRSHASVSEDAKARHEASVAIGISRDRVAAFEKFYAEREAKKSGIKEVPEI